MARTLKVTDDSTTVDLIGSYWRMLQGSFFQRAPKRRSVWRSSMFSEGRSLVLSAPENVVETFKVNLERPTHDTIATQVRLLGDLARKARLYHTTKWHYTPVYLQSQTTDETNPRYALVYDIDIDFGSSLYDPPMDPGNLVKDITISIEREPYWRNTKPGTLSSKISVSSPDNFGPTDEGMVINAYMDSGELTHIFNYDSSVPEYSANLYGTTPHYCFEVNNPVALNDIMLFGGDEPFHMIAMYVGTAYVGSGTVVTVEYYNGAWVAGGQLTKRLCEEYPRTGVMTLVFDGRSDWTTTTVNGVSNKYWLRLRISTIGTWTSSPIISTYPIKSITKSYVGHGGGAGDAPSLVMYKLNSYAKDTTGIITNAYFGAKSRGLTYFRGRVVCNDGGYTYGTWTESYGDDTADFSDPRAGAGGNACKCTFATEQGMVVRFSALNETPAEIDDWEGEYAVFITAEQTGGSAGDVEIMFRHVIFNAYASSRYVKTTMVANGPELFHMGRISLFPCHVFSTSEDPFDYLKFEVHAMSNNGTTPDLEIFEIIFIPIDEWAGAVATDQSVMNIGMQRHSILEIDYGLRRYGATIQHEQDSWPSYTSVLGNWEMRGGFPFIDPESSYYIFWLFSDEGVAHASLGAGINAYMHSRYSLMRGSGS